jgi:hypothetical protein
MFPQIRMNYDPLQPATYLEPLPTAASPPLPHHLPILPLVVPAEAVSPLPLEFPVAPTPQGLKLGCHIERLLAALLGC